MSVSFRLSWQERVSLSAGDGDAVVAGPEARVALRPAPPELLAAMQRLRPPGEDENRLADSILETGSADSLARWFYHIDQFRRRGLVCRSLYDGDRTLATLLPISAAGGPAPAGHAKGNRAVRACWFVLSRFACLRREGSRMILESPLANARVVIHDPQAVAVVGALAMPAAVSDLVEEFGDFSVEAIVSLVALLDEARLLDRLGTGAADAASESPELEPWEFHDLLFHARSRRGRSDARFGGTFRLTHRPAPPALKPARAGEWQDLFVPDLPQLERTDPPLAQVQRTRRSIREYAAAPLTLRQLGEFLYRVARVTGTWTAEVQAPSGSVTLDFAARPYPAAGALYELEFYVAALNCAGLVPGLYRYDPHGHRLGRIRELDREVSLLLDDAARSTGIVPEKLQVLIVLGARFERLAWKYESIAYSLVLKDVGVVYQTMYLTATAMGLAPCAVGCGDSDLFARAAGTDYYVEPSVGEFLLGSRL